MRKLIMLLVVSFAILFVACGQSGLEPTESVQTTTQEAPVTQDQTSAQEPSPSQTAISAESLLDAFLDAGVPIIHMEIFTSATCPNNLLGRPGEYYAKINWHDERYMEYWWGDDFIPEADATVEVFRNRSEMERRRNHIQAVQHAMPLLGGQYIFYSDTMLLRIPFRVSPESAAEYEDIFRGLIGQ